MNTERNKRLLFVRAVVVVLAFLLLFASPWLSANVFAYEVEETKTVEEPYEYVVDEIWDYICYTTTFGECYHEDGCQYLHSSAHKTTVADAKDNGYRACSRCDPPIELPFVVKETRYRTVTKTKVETKEPTFLVCVIGESVIILGYYLIAKKIKKGKMIQI